jgi:hypothetical protein
MIKSIVERIFGSNMEDNYEFGGGGIKKRKEQRNEVRSRKKEVDKEERTKKRNKEKKGTK